jgi:hypothetical protein
MAKSTAGPPIGGRGTGPINVAVQRPTVNLKEAENVGEQAKAVGNKISGEGFRFSRHGTLGPAKPTAIEKAWE